MTMANFVLIHGAGDVGWYWHLVQTELRERGHDAVAPDLPCEDDSAGLGEYAAVVVDAIGDRNDIVVVGTSFGGYTAALVANQLVVRALVLVNGMIPAPGERGEDWFASTGWEQAVEQRAALDGGKTGDPDPYVTFYHDVPRALAEEALSRERRQSETPGREPWPLDDWPSVPAAFVVCTEDRFFPDDFMRRVVTKRLGILPDEIHAGHCVALSRPAELADRLVAYLNL